MSNSNGRSVFGRRPGTVTVIEEPVRRSSARNAKILFWVVWAVTGLLAATVLASKWHPILALLAGVLVGLVLGLITAAFVVAWPVLRAMWWWSIEIVTIIDLIGGWMYLAEHTTLPYRLAAVTLITGVPAAIGPVRRRVLALAWCLVTRHRLRTCFSEFIITNRYGTLPLILFARPTAVGERVWIWLRPGLALPDIQQRLDLIAVACWATAVTAEGASASNSALIRLDIRRRDALSKTVKSPLTAIAADTEPVTEPRATSPAAPSALDLTDIPAAEITPIRPQRANGRPPSAPPIPTIPVPAAAGSDIEDWI